MDASAPDSLDVKVSLVAGQAHTVHTERHTSVANLKAKLQGVTSIPPGEQQLVHKYDVLSDESSLAEACAKVEGDGHTLYLQLVRSLPKVPGLKVDPELLVAEWFAEKGDGSGEDDRLQRVRDVIPAAFFQQAFMACSGYSGVQDMVDYLVKILASVGIHTFRQLDAAVCALPTAERYRSFWTGLDTREFFVPKDALDFLEEDVEDYPDTTCSMIGQNVLHELLGAGSPEKFKPKPGTSTEDYERVVAVRGSGWQEHKFAWIFKPEVGLVRVVGMKPGEGEAVRVPDIGEVSRPGHAEGNNPEDDVPITPPESCVDPEDYYALPPSSEGSRSIPYELLRVCLKVADEDAATPRTPTAIMVQFHLRDVTGVEVNVDSVVDLAAGSALALVRCPSVQAAATVFVKHHEAQARGGADLRGEAPVEWKVMEVQFARHAAPAA